MEQLDILRARAAEYGTDVDDPSGLGKLRTCKCMLEKLFKDLRYTSHVLLEEDIPIMEAELLAIRITFDDIYYSVDRVTFMSLGHVNSTDELVKSAREAYSYMSTALIRLLERDEDETDKTAAIAHNDISQSFSACQDAIWRTLQEILIL